MVGGRNSNESDVHNKERIFRGEFPEKPGALLAFLEKFGIKWNISLFHYRNLGSAFAKILVGIEDQSKDKNFMYYSFVYVTDKEFIPTLNNESSGYAWVNIGNWPKPLHDGARNTLARNKGIDKLHTILNINSK